MEQDEAKGKISRGAFARLAALFLVGQFVKGVYGLKRLQKVMYLATRSAEHAPFTYRRYLYGQYSDDLDDTKDQLIAMHYVCPIPLDTSQTTTFTLEGRVIELQEGGSRYVLDAGREAATHFVTTFQRAAPATADAIRSAVRDYGYMAESALIEHCYGLPEFVKSLEGEVLLRANLPPHVEVLLSEDECDDLELALSPRTMQALTQIVEGLDLSQMDWGSLKEVDLSIPFGGA